MTVDKGALKLLAESQDNNERYELLERFKNYVVPHLDDPSAAHADIRTALMASVRAARITRTRPINTPWGDFAGKTAKDILDLAADVLDHFRYISFEAIQVTFDALCELFPDGNEREKARIVKSVKSLAAHNFEVWKAIGPAVQDILIKRVQGWDAGTLEALRPVAMIVLEEALRPDVRGTSSNYKSFTLTTGNVVSSDTLTQIRTRSLDLLERLFRSSTSDLDRREVRGALLSAMRFPQRGSASPALTLTVLRDSARIVKFFDEFSSTLDHGLLESLEERLLWLYRHTRRPADAPPEDAPNAEARRALIQAIFAFRDHVNGDRAFVTYKTLVGFESVFAPDWGRDSKDIEGAEEYRNERISELVGQVNAANADEWLAVLQRCAGTKTDDLATFPPLMRFLEELARTKPEIVESYLGRLGDDLGKGFLPSLLAGLEATPRWPVIKEKIEAWVSDGRYLSQIVFFQRRAVTVDVPLTKRALNLAIAAEDDIAAIHAASVCALRSDAIPRDELAALFTTAITYFKGKEDTQWVNAIWAYLKDPLVEALTDDQLDLVLAALVPRQRIDDSAEWVLARLAKRSPTKVIDFFGARLRHRTEDEGVVDGFESVPYRFTKLGPKLVLTGEYLLAKCREWHHAARNEFEFRGGGLISVIFPELTPELEGLLKHSLAATEEGAPQFVADLLRGYQGSPATHELYKMIIEIVPDEDPALAAIEGALISTGGVSGEFGMREAYQRKKAEIQPWLTDARPRVKAFAVAHDRMLDRMIASEQRRAEEDLEFRKRQYGDGNDAVAT